MANSRSNMGTTLRADAPPQEPRNGSGEVQDGDFEEQQAFDFDTPLFWTQRVTKALKETIEEHWGQDAFAADFGLSRQSLNQKLRRAQNSKGEVERWHGDMLGFVMSQFAPRWTFLSKLNAECGAKSPVPVRELTANEKRAILAEALTADVKRDLERRHGLPKGNLDK